MSHHNLQLKEYQKKIDDQTEFATASVVDLLTLLAAKTITNFLQERQLLGVVDDFITESYERLLRWWYVFFSTNTFTGIKFANYPILNGLHYWVRERQMSLSLSEPITSIPTIREGVNDTNDMLQPVFWFFVRRKISDLSYIFKKSNQKMVSDGQFFKDMFQYVYEDKALAAQKSHEFMRLLPTSYRTYIPNMKALEFLIHNEGNHTEDSVRAGDAVKNFTAFVLSLSDKNSPTLNSSSNNALKIKYLELLDIIESSLKISHHNQVTILSNFLVSISVITVCYSLYFTFSIEMLAGSLVANKISHIFMPYLKRLIQKINHEWLFFKLRRTDPTIDRALFNTVFIDSVIPTQSKNIFTALETLSKKENSLLSYLFNVIMWLYHYPRTSLVMLMIPYIMFVLTIKEDTMDFEKETPWLYSVIQYLLGLLFIRALTETKNNLQHYTAPSKEVMLKCLNEKKEANILSYHLRNEDFFVSIAGNPDAEKSTSLLMYVHENLLAKNIDSICDLQNKRLIVNLKELYDFKKKKTQYDEALDIITCYSTYLTLKKAQRLQQKVTAFIILDFEQCYEAYRKSTPKIFTLWIQDIGSRKKEALGQKEVSHVQPPHRTPNPSLLKPQHLPVYPSCMSDRTRQPRLPQTPAQQLVENPPASLRHKEMHACYASVFALKVDLYSSNSSIIADNKAIVLQLTAALTYYLHIKSSQDKLIYMLTFDQILDIKDYSDKLQTVMLSADQIIKNHASEKRLPLVNFQEEMDAEKIITLNKFQEISKNHLLIKVRLNDNPRCYLFPYEKKCTECNKTVVYYIPQLIIPNPKQHKNF